MTATSIVAAPETPALPPISGAEWIPFDDYQLYKTAHTAAKMMDLAIRSWRGFDHATEKQIEVIGLMKKAAHTENDRVRNDLLDEAQYFRDCFAEIYPDARKFKADLYRASELAAKLSALTAEMARRLE